ncbi:group-specific protein [Bacillus toyonensis]|uniref:S-Ena type endospore appendage n=1 Tax=Bacillus toyonensis TaxID=155322 RepID=UPI000BFCE246|nr:S-Ena type endospore appendage [Bacillus toyonensis]PHD58297.1 group-specific protein [Bacillus toyonensis]
MKNKKNIGCFAPLSIICPDPCPPPPPPNPSCELVTNEFAGNFLITNSTIPSAKDALQSMILWQSDEILLISGTVSVYNSTSSTEAITIQIVGAVTNIFTVFPGNTISYTGKGLISVSIINIQSNSSLYLEGKYCCQFTCCL